MAGWFYNGGGGGGWGVGRLYIVGRGASPHFMKTPYIAFAPPFQILSNLLPPPPLFSLLPPIPIPTVLSVILFLLLDA